MPSPVILPALAFTAGVAAGIWLAGPTQFISTPILLIIGLLLAVASWRRPSLRRPLLISALGVAGALHGASARDAALHPSLRAVLDAAYGDFAIDTIGAGGRHDPIRLRALLTEDAANAGEFTSLRVEAEAVLVGDRWQPVEGGLALTVSGASAQVRLREWRAGRTIEAPVTFRRPARYLNDGVQDFERDAALGGIALLGSVKSALLVEVVRRGSRVSEAAAVVRKNVRHAVARWVSPHGEIPAAIVTAVLIGDRTGLPDDIRDRLQAAGTYHVIAISGGNIAILAALIVGTLAIVGVQGRYASLAALAMLLAYAQVASAGPSVWRATFMATLYFGARVVDHRTPSWHALAIAAAAIAAVHPLDVRDAGFLLTFGATAGLLHAGRATGAWKPTTRVAAWIVLSITASLAAEVVVLPVSAVVLSRVTAAGLLLNLLAVPVMAVVQVAGMAVVAFDRADAFASAAGWVAARGASVLVESARLVDVVPSLAHRVPPAAVWVVAAYYVALLAAWWSRTTSVRHASRVVLATTGVLIVTGANPLSWSHHPAALRLTIFDVGQGESILLEAGGQTLMIDTGGSPFGGGGDIGARVLAPALWARGIRGLGALLVTHADPDHIGGATAIVADFRPRDLWWGTPVWRHLPSQAVLQAAADRGSHVESRRAGQALTFGPARVRVFNPPVPDWERQRVRNDDSVVLEVAYRDVSLLLTGDIGADVERVITPQLSPARIRILKVAHHGSRTSSSQQLLESWRPQIALISCGRGNTFGHPAPDVIARLESIGARIYRTDRDGEITLETEGRTLRVTTFIGGGR